MRPGKLCQLHPDRPDRAACAIDQHTLAGRDSRNLHEMQCRERAKGQGGRLGEIQSIRYRQQRRSLGHDLVFGVNVIDVHPKHPLPNLDARDILADGFDNA